MDNNKINMEETREEELIATIEDRIDQGLVNPTPNKRTYSVYEIQDILGISLPTAYVLVKKGEFKSVRIGRTIRISKKSFDDWLDQHLG